MCGCACACSLFTFFIEIVPAGWPIPPPGKRNAPHYVRIDRYLGFSLSFPCLSLSPTTYVYTLLQKTAGFLEGRVNGRISRACVLRGGGLIPTRVQGSLSVCRSLSRARALSVCVLRVIVFGFGFEDNEGEGPVPPLKSSCFFGPLRPSPFSLFSTKSSSYFVDYRDGGVCV